VLTEGSTTLRYAGLSVTGGRLVQRDEVSSPYSLFLSGARKSANGVSLEYAGDLFFYETRWIELTRNSAFYKRQIPVLNADGHPTGDYVTRSLDRGANYKVYGASFGDWRVGFQESVVYVDQTFYPEYFLSPLPMFFTQLVNGSYGKPWTQESEENSMMGIFGEYSRQPYYGYAQFLIDDFNEFGLDFLAPGTWNNPAKLAWSLGGSWESPVGTVSLYHGGATQYTFQATYAYDSYSDFPYEYTYYPAVEFEKGGELEPIDPEDNYVGYKHGENNLAFAAGFDSRAYGFDWGVSGEYTISGEKSPNNPWNDGDRYPRTGTRIFSRVPLEHRFTLGADIQRRLGQFVISGSGEVTRIENELKLSGVPGAPEEPKIYRPTKQERIKWMLSLGLRWEYETEVP